jgi:hypothetical protein
MPTTRDKRLFHLAELLAAELNKSKGDVQPEDILSFMQCNVPISEDESSEEYEDMMHEHNQRTAGRGTSAIGKLRKSLGFADGDSIISVIEKAAEFIETDRSSRLPKTADGVPFFIGDTVFSPNHDREYFGPDPVVEMKVDYISKGASFVEYRGDFTIGTDGDMEGGNLDFYSTREACPNYG